MEEKNLILVCEGQVHTIEYMHKNKVYPKTVVFDCSKFKEIAPYLGKSDEVLVVINGATDFSIAMIYSLLRDLENIESKLAGVTVLSNIDLGKINTPYYLYKGDLFYGDVIKMVKGKPIEKEDVTVTKKDKGVLKSLLSKRGKEVETVTDKEEFKVNEVMAHFLSYNRPVKVMIHGITKREQKVINDEFAKKIIDIDLFN